MRPLSLFISSLILIQLINIDLAGQSRVYGYVRDSENNPVSMVNVFIKDSNTGIITSDSGRYELNVPSNKNIIIIASCVGFLPEVYSVFLRPGNEINYDFTLKRDIKAIDEVVVISKSERASIMSNINVKTIEMVPVSIGGVEALIKTLPGVSSNNELSSQYSVRGGNFDENLIYINDIEIYRPFLVRSGQQEGLSFINSDLVSSIKFSAGGFDASYGDKMSSVLDISYRRPNEFAGSIAFSLLGGSISLEGISKDKKLSYISGFRYKTNRYLLGSLETSGEYLPKFIDYQGLLTWNPFEKIEFSFLGNFAQNQYNFIPSNRNTDFGTANIPLNLKIYYEGQEKDQFDTYFGAFTFKYTVNSNLNLKLISSGFSSFESETYDILGEYLINELDNTIGSSTYGDSILNIGIGGFLNHARNYLDSRVYSISHIGDYSGQNHRIKWGINYQNDFFSDKVSEWDMIDSAGFSSPYNPENLVVRNLVKTKNSLQSYKLSSFTQDTWTFRDLKNEYFITSGIRATYLSLTNQLLLSPRFLFSLKPKWERDIMFHVSTGVYFQAPFYKESRNPQGIINKDLKPQRSFQILTGGDYIFQAWDRPFKFTTELYYKNLKNIIPYKIDNIRVTYSGENMAKGYVAGIDFKLNGEFVKGAESWTSISFMRAREDIENDAYGAYPRPTDQLMNFGLFFQDYFPNNPDYKVHLYFLYGSRLPYSSPNKEKYNEIYRLPPYRRVDLGFSKVLIKESASGNLPKKPFRFLKNVWISAEIFNLLGVNNTISYLWVQTVSNQENIPDIFAVPNHLTGRQLNIRLLAKF